MSRPSFILALTAASACLLGACDHLYGGADIAAAPSSGPGFGALGDDLPAAGTAKRDPADAAAARLVSIDMPVADLCARPAARAVVERDLPGLTGRPEYVFFKHMSLRQLQAASGGRMTSAELEQVSDDLGAQPPGAGAPVGAARGWLWHAFTHAGPAWGPAGGIRSTSW